MGDKIVVPGTGVEVPLDLDLSRRDLLKIAGYGSIAAFLAACAGGSPTTTTTTSVTAKGGSVSLGSYLSDAVPKKGLQSVVDAFISANGGTKVKVNTVDHGTFQNQINSYLQGTPEDVFTWFSGHRMRFFADKGLAAPIDDAWNEIKGNFTEGFAASVKGNDGHVYAIPTSYYPWAVFYRKDVFQQHSYSVPNNWDDFKKLADQMKKDGLTPIAFADKDGWPAMGTFDILNLRINGYDFHISLMNGKEDWTDPKVSAVFDQWKGLLPYHQTGSLGRTWQEAAQSLSAKKTGMYLLGMFVGQQFTGAAHDDLDFFNFPEVDSTVGADTLDAPIDGFMLSKKPKNEDGAKALLKFL